MKDRTMHPTTENLEAFAEGTIAPADGSVIESHLLGCPRCENVIEEWRSLFHALAALPRFVPTSGFTDRVMLRVRIPQPWHARAAATLGRLLPRTTRGWALAAALLALPILAGGTFFGWLLSKSYVTTHGLWVYGTDRMFNAVQALVTSAALFLMETDVAAWLVKLGGTLLTTGGVRGVGVLAAGGAVLTIVSIWVLYTNLFRTSDRESTYVTFSF